MPILSGLNEQTGQRGPADATDADMQQKLFRHDLAAVDESLAYSR